MIPYHRDQEQKEQQQEAYAQRQQERWEDGYNDALNHRWDCCQTKTESCSRYCTYLAGHLWGLEEKTIRYLAECRSNLATLDTEF
jgi:hypothetical protein